MESIRTRMDWNSMVYTSVSSYIFYHSSIISWFSSVARRGTDLEATGSLFFSAIRRNAVAVTFNLFGLHLSEQLAPICTYGMGM